MSKTYFFYKPASGMHGPHALTRDNVLKFVPREYGIYFLSSPAASNGQPLVCYVGRSAELEGRLLDHVGTGYSSFYYKSTQRSAYTGLENEKEAYRAECEEYHLYGQTKNLDNEIHPASPTAYSHCHVCGT